MPQVNLTSNATGGGVTIASFVTRTADSVSGLEPALPAGKDVTAWVYTSGSVAACNLPGGHGYSNGNFDVYWTIAGVNYRRYNVPGTIATNALSLSGGSGDNFPASATTGIVVTKQAQINCAIDGDLATILVLNLLVAGISGQRGHATFYDVGNAIIANVDLPVAPYDFVSLTSNPFTGNPITYIKASNASSATDGTFQIIVGQDSTP
jgi:hypothetical protein